MHCLVGDGGMGTLRGEVTDYRAQCWAEPDHSQHYCEQPRCNNSGTGGLKGDSLAGIGLQPRQLTLVDAETSPSDGGELKCNRCEGSFPVYECLCVQTCGELSNGNYMMEDRVMKTDRGLMKAGDDDTQEGGGILGRWVHQVFCRKPSVLDSLCEASCPTGPWFGAFIFGFFGIFNVVSKPIDNLFNILHSKHVSFRAMIVLIS